MNREAGMGKDDDKGFDAHSSKLEVKLYKLTSTAKGNKINKQSSILSIQAEKKGASLTIKSQVILTKITPLAIF